MGERTLLQSQSWQFASELAGLVRRVETLDASRDASPYRKEFLKILRGLDDAQMTFEKLAKGTKP